MAQYSIHDTCGHEVIHQIFGIDVNGERERKAERLATQPFQPCHRTAIREANAPSNAAALDDSAKRVLPRSPALARQIVWAASPRAGALSRNDHDGLLLLSPQGRARFWHTLTSAEHWPCPGRRQAVPDHIWRVAETDKSGQYMLVNQQSGEPFRERGTVVRWCSDVGAGVMAEQLAAQAQPATSGQTWSEVNDGDGW